MRYSPTAEEIGTRNIEEAARWGKSPSPALFGGIGSELYIVHVPAVREVPLPEPVTWQHLNGREPVEWEVPLIVAARTRERRLELSLLAGTLGQP